MNTKTNLITYTPTTLPTAQLWVGHHDTLVEEVQQLAQRILCKNNGCHTCITCMQIRDKQHHAMMWLYPDKTYTIEQFDDLFATIAFRLEDNQLFFFIIQKADALTVTCANKLLKSIEEPPAGYHFILLTERTDQLLPTIISRCITHIFSAPDTATTIHPLFTSFTTSSLNKKHISDFSKLLDTNTINERESIELLDEILRYWIIAYKTNIDAPKDEHKHIPAIISVLKNAYTQLPMPGSCTTFWRNLYLQMTTISR